MTRVWLGGYLRPLCPRCWQVWFQGEIRAAASLSSEGLHVESA
jgi:hypothetical protein